MEMTAETLNFPVISSEGGLFGGEAATKKIASYSAAKDFDLTQAAAAGDMGAFEEIYQRHHRRVYSICLRMLQNAHEAEDLTQDVFIQLYRKIGSFRGDSAFTTWLHRMTVNQVLMHFRKRNVKFEKTTEEGETPDQVVAGTANPDKMPIVDKIALENAIDQLPEGYKNVFVLHDVEGFEHEEVAKILGCSVGTSKSQLHKARLKLRKLLKKKANPRLLGFNT
jgi:RNA polymerase sigma-70 factor (ECF subfamily)